MRSLWCVGDGHGAAGRRAGGQPRPSVCALQEVEMENGGGSQKWCTLIPGWPTAGRERRTAAAQSLPPRSRFARVNLDETRCRWSQIQIHDTDELEAMRNFKPMSLRRAGSRPRGSPIFSCW